MMEKLITSQTQANLPTIDQLKGIWFLIKSFQITSAEELINGFDEQLLTNAGLRMYYQYLRVKISLFHFQTSNDIKALKKAEKDMDALIQISKDAHVRLQDPNFLQSQCFIQWKLSEYGDTLKERVAARKLAWKLVHIGIEKYNLDCFYWLQAQLQDVI